MTTHLELQDLKTPLQLVSSKANTNSPETMIKRIFHRYHDVLSCHSSKIWHLLQIEPHQALDIHLQPSFLPLITINKKLIYQMAPCKSSSWTSSTIPTFMDMNIIDKYLILLFSFSVVCKLYDWATYFDSVLTEIFGHTDARWFQFFKNAFNEVVMVYKTNTEKVKFRGLHV